jgi:hypothetical protein
VRESVLEELPSHLSSRGSAAGDPVQKGQWFEGNNPVWILSEKPSEIHPVCTREGAQGRNCEGYFAFGNDGTSRVTVLVLSPGRVQLLDSVC